MDWGDNDPVLEGRLENWGRWAADSSNHRGTSPLYRIIEAGLTKEEVRERERGRQVVKVDEKDAKIINDAVLSTPFDTLRDRRGRAMFVSLYTSPYLPLHALLRTFRVSEREFVRSVKRIRHIVANYLQRTEERDKLGGNN